MATDGFKLNGVVPFRDIVLEADEIDLGVDSLRFDGLGVTLTVTLVVLGLSF